MSDVIAMPVYILFKNSLQTGTIPKIWKIANITAINTKGDKKFAGNYRPVSLTCIVCKLLEKIIRESIVNHMKKYNLFSDKQYGFYIWKVHSAATTSSFGVMDSQELGPSTFKVLELSSAGCFLPHFLGFFS